MVRRAGSVEVTLDVFPTESLDPMRLIAQLPLRPYQSIVDMRSDSGHFTIPLAKSLFDGKVYAMDRMGGDLKELKEKLPKTRLTNIEVITTKKGQQAISEERLDGALVPFVLHAAADKESFLQEVMKFLRRGAWVAVLEWQKKEDDEDPPMAKRLSDSEVVAMAERVGLRFSGKRHMSSRHYLVMLRK